MLALVTTIKLIAEIALLVLLGQLLVGLMLGPSTPGNLALRGLQLLARPWLVAARFLSPKVVLDQHLPLVALFLLLLVWIAAALLKVSLCLQLGIALCK